VNVALYVLEVVCKCFCTRTHLGILILLWFSAIFATYCSIVFIISLWFVTTLHKFIEPSFLSPNAFVFKVVILTFTSLHRCTEQSCVMGNGLLWKSRDLVWRDYLTLIWVRHEATHVFVIKKTYS
jgi:hypothetical protein